MQMATKSYIALNFLPLETQHFDFTVYRRHKSSQGETKLNGTHERWLPISNTFEHFKEAPKESYWICYEQREGFEQFSCSSQTDFNLTKDYLFHLLKLNSRRLADSDYELPECEEDDFKYLRIEYVLHRHQPNSREVVWLEPYYLWSKKEFGFLIDFSLNVPRDSKFEKRDLELSLTHKQGRRNFDFYSDRFDKIKEFVVRFHSRIFPLRNNNAHI